MENDCVILCDRLNNINSQKLNSYPASDTPAGLVQF